MNVFKERLSKRVCCHPPFFLTHCVEMCRVLAQRSAEAVICSQDKAIMSGLLPRLRAWQSRALFPLHVVRQQVCLEHISQRDCCYNLSTNQLPEIQLF